LFPVFSNSDGHVSVFMVREIINAAFRELGRDFTPEEIDAIDTFRATAQRLQFETRLAGEIETNRHLVQRTRQLRGARIEPDACPESRDPFLRAPREDQG
jgi:hypothetical protein